MFEEFMIEWSMFEDKGEGKRWELVNPQRDASGNASGFSEPGELFFERDIVNARKILLI
ncbi:MAG: hypothetical protein PVF22_04765 [Candidatus Aminicenantes bacterium]|jgi:hypothetical protein